MTRRSSMQVYGITYCSDEKNKFVMISGMMNMLYVLRTPNGIRAGGIVDWGACSLGRAHSDRQSHRATTARRHIS